MMPFCSYVVQQPFLSCSTYSYGYKLSDNDFSLAGNILENKELLASLNQTKASSTTISDSLKESIRLQADLDKVSETLI